MLSCKEVTQLLSESQERKLPWHKRISLRMHIRACKYCTRYKDQLIFISEVMSRYLEAAEKNPPSEALKLSEDSKKRLRESMGNSKSDL